MNKPRECWVVTDGRAGIENQALGLAEAVGRETELIITKKKIAVDAPWKSLPRVLWGDPFSKLSRQRSLLRPPFPDLWIGCGRLSVPFTLEVKNRSPETFTVQLQNPHAPLHKFDLLIPPEHDRLEGDNVFSILGSPNRITRERLQEDAIALAPLVEDLARPRIAVLVGGSNSVNKVDAKQAERFRAVLRDVSKSGASLMITVSRRTPEFLVESLKEDAASESIFLWDGEAQNTQANPYLGILGLADSFIVTEDSVNMASEAGVTGRPVHIHHWRDNSKSGLSPKFEAFHKSLEGRGVSRSLSGDLADWTYEPLDETRRAADEILHRWDHRDVTRDQRAFAAS